MKKPSAKKEWPCLSGVCPYGYTQCDVCAPNLEEDGTGTLIVAIDIQKFLEEFPGYLTEVLWPDLGKPITQDEIRKQVIYLSVTPDKLEVTPYNPIRFKPWRRCQHARRIAHFVIHGITDPIQMDLGCPDLGSPATWPIEDGHHRFLAAVFRGDKFILAYAGGELEYINTFQYQGDDTPAENTSA